MRPFYSSVVCVLKFSTCRSFYVFISYSMFFFFICIKNLKHTLYMIRRVIHERKKCVTSVVFVYIFTADSNILYLFFFISNSYLHFRLLISIFWISFYAFDENIYRFYSSTVPKRLKSKKTVLVYKNSIYLIFVYKYYYLNHKFSLGANAFNWKLIKIERLIVVWFKR